MVLGMGMLIFLFSVYGTLLYRDLTKSYPSKAADTMFRYTKVIIFCFFLMIICEMTQELYTNTVFPGYPSKGIEPSEEWVARTPLRMVVQHIKCAVVTIPVFMILLIFRRAAAGPTKKKPHAHAHFRKTARRVKHASKLNPKNSSRNGSKSSRTSYVNRSSSDASPQQRKASMVIDDNEAGAMEKLVDLENVDAEKRDSAMAVSVLQRDSMRNSSLKNVENLSPRAADEKLANKNDDLLFDPELRSYASSPTLDEQSKERPIAEESSHSNIVRIHKKAPRKLEPLAHNTHTNANTKTIPGKAVRLNIRNSSNHSYDSMIT
jgi:hypothetical protein